MKRSREAQLSKTRLVHHPNHDDPCAMMVDDDSATTFTPDDAGFDADKDDDDDAVDTYYSSSDANGDQPRRKRAMLIKANIQFLQKLPPLRNYQRGQFGRRGAVDGGTPDSDMGMNALEETMGESSFAVSSRAPTVARAAIVAPAPVLSSFQRCQQQHQQQQYQQIPQYPQVHSVHRNTSIAFASMPPASLDLIQYRHSGLTHSASNANSKKDDESRPATNGTGFW